MDSSFTPIEQMLKFRASRHEDFPYQEIDVYKRQGSASVELRSFNVG